MKMTEKELFGKLQELRQIKPKKDWAISAKTQILGETPGFTLFSYFNPALAGLISVFILVGLFGFAQNSLPGDILYPIKKITEKSRAVFVSEEDQPQADLELANKRLEELTKIAETNQVKKLAPAINEFQANISEAAKNLSKIDATTSSPVAMKKIVEENKKLEENKQKVRSLGIVIEGEGTAEWEGVLKKMVENLISDLEERTLNEAKEEILNRIKELVSEEKYSEALELYLMNQ